MYTHAIRYCIDKLILKIKEPPQSLFNKEKTADVSTLTEWVTNQWNLSQLANILTTDLTCIHYQIDLRQVIGAVVGIKCICVAKCSQESNTAGLISYTITNRNKYSNSNKDELIIDWSNIRKEVQQQLIQVLTDKFNTNPKNIVFDGYICF